MDYRTPINVRAWALCCRYYRRGKAIPESSLCPPQKEALVVLRDLKAVQRRSVNLDHIMCPFCGMEGGPVVDTPEGLACDCVDCGLVPAGESDLSAWTCDTDWLIRRLRLAMDISPQQTPKLIVDGAWLLGQRQRHAVVLAPNFMKAIEHPTLLGRVRAGGVSTWLITPRAEREPKINPADYGVDWLPLEERFELRAGSLRFMSPHAVTEPEPMDAVQFIHGPFSADFRWVQLDGRADGPILLTQAQADVFAVLWKHRRQPLTGMEIMRRAGLKSDRPMDVFKVKATHKGRPEFDGPLAAYKALVVAQQRAGTYQLIESMIAA